MNEKFTATLVDIKRIHEVPEELMPYVSFKAEIEGRKIKVKGSERVAIFNIASTTSYIPVFLDAGKTIEDVEREIKEQAFAKLSSESREVIKKALK
ncbi:MAG: DUF749 family protein [Candidatus Hydrothermarchaeota archaeon]|nr:DUF749 family protein [Candidatus Hydrothermarchaeota archaeon]